MSLAVLATRRNLLRVLATAGSAGFAHRHAGEAASKPKRRKRRRGARKRRQKRSRHGRRYEWQLTFSDEFRGGSLNSNKWAKGPPWVPEPSDRGELQRYVPDALRLDNGVLRIVATRDSGKYRSGMATTFGSFSQRYGRFEIRCRFPAGKGLWPAFWLLPRGAFGPPEIDVLEGLGHERNAVYMNVHWRDRGKHRQALGKHVGPDFTEDFHTYTLVWDKDKLVWYVDGVQRHRVDGHSPRRPMYLLANLAVGGNWPGNPDRSTRFPTAFVIDYIRVYRKVAAA